MFKTLVQKKIISFLDWLLYISINEDELIKKINIDSNLYKLLNSSKVNSEIIHMNCYKIVNENTKPTNEFINFIDNILGYIHYDIHLDFIWAKISHDQNQQREVYENITQKRNNILSFLLNKKLISQETYSKELNFKIKQLED